MVLGIDGDNIEVDLWQSFFAQAKSIGIKVGNGKNITRAEIIRIQAEKVQHNKGTCDFKMKLVRKSTSKKTEQTQTIDYAQMVTLTQDDEHRMINIKGQALNTTDLDELESGNKKTIIGDWAEEKNGDHILE